MSALRKLSFCGASLVASVLGYLISSKLPISVLKSAKLIAFNFRCVIVCATAWRCFVGIFKLATTEMWSEIIPDVDTERPSLSLENIIKSSS